MAFSQVTQCGKACSGLYPHVIMLSNGSLVNKIVIKCQFSLTALYFKYISVLTCVRHQPYPSPPLHRGCQTFSFVNVLCYNRMTQDQL